VGVQAAGLLPSVRCGLEAALLSALAAAASGDSLAALLSPAEAAMHLSAAAQTTPHAAGSVQVCGLVDSFPSAAATAAAAVQLVRQGHTTLKLKVIDRAQPPSTSMCSPTCTSAQAACMFSQPSHIGRWVSRQVWSNKLAGTRARVVQTTRSP
jgi:L-alanine-DL-glutamate epimerase-like enolase superfamily enzyme